MIYDRIAIYFIGIFVGTIIGMCIGFMIADFRQFRKERKQ